MVFNLPCFSQIENTTTTNTSTIEFPITKQHTNEYRNRPTNAITAELRTATTKKRQAETSTMSTNTSRNASNSGLQVRNDEIRSRPNERKLYQRAKILLESTRRSWIFRMVASFSSERKLLVSMPGKLCSAAYFETQIAYILPFSLLDVRSGLFGGMQCNFCSLRSHHGKPRLA